MDSPLGAFSRVERHFRRSWVAGGALLAVFVLGGLAAFAPLLANSAPLLYDDGRGWSSPALRHFDHGDWRWLGGYLLVALSTLRVFFGGAVRRRRVLGLAAGLFVVHWFAVGQLPVKVASEELWTWERLRDEGPQDHERVHWCPVKFSPEVPDLNLLTATPPGDGHPFGTDGVGMDLCARVVYGARVSLLVGLVATLIALGLGVTVGAVAGYFGGWVDQVFSRVVEVFQCFPDLVLILVVLAYLPPEPLTVMALIGVLGWTGVARLTRAEFLRLRNLGFVDAQRALGSGTGRLLVVHLLPHALAPVLVAATFGMAGAMLTEASLSFLGLGGSATSWGKLLSESRYDLLQAPWMLWFPGAALFLAVTAYNFAGEAVRDALDPRPRDRGGRRASTPSERPGAGPGALLSVRGLNVAFGHDEPVVDGLDLELREGEALGLVGESGCGKSVTALAILRLLDSEPGSRQTGSIRWDGREVMAMSPVELRALRGGEIGIVFQEPGAALDPVYRVGAQVAEAITVHRRVAAGAVAAEVLDRLDHAGLADPASAMRSFPHELSGGMQQRSMIAVALAGTPRLLIADEPTTALDVTVQAHLLGRVRRLREEDGLAILWISHDLAVVAEVCDRIAVVLAGRIVERGSVEDLRRQPSHPYTRELIEALPEHRDRRANPANEGLEQRLPWSEGCAYRAACPWATALCEQDPPWREVARGHEVRCHHDGPTGEVGP